MYRQIKKKITIERNREKFMKRKGYTILELVVSISLIGLIFIISLPGFYSSDLRYEMFVYTLKSDLRLISVEAMNKPTVYRIIFNNDGYEIYKGKYFERSVKCPKGININTLERRIMYSQKKRSGTPGKSTTIHIKDHMAKKAGRVTIMLGSGRIHSYRSEYIER